MLLYPGNMEVLPSTQDSGTLIRGSLQHGFVSDQLNTGMGDFKYVQDMDKSGGYLELHSDSPLLGKFNFKTQHYVSVYNILPI